MAQCPNCHKSIEILDKHLGTLYTCSSCNAVFFVDWDGQPEMANHEVEIEAPIEEAFVPPDDVPVAPYETQIEPTVVGSISELISNEVMEELSPQEQIAEVEEHLQAVEEIPAGSAIESFDHSENLPEVVSESGEPESEIEQYDFNRSLEQAPPQPMQSMTSDSSNFADITDFANANAEAGPLSYVVVIDGIETSHLLKQLREAMTDSRFGWDVATLLGKMAGGRLILSGLSPAKASVLINRIKYLPFKISWRQDVLSNS